MEFSNLKIISKFRNHFQTTLLFPPEVTYDFTPAKLFFENGGLLTYSLVSQIFKFGFRTRVRSFPNALRLATPKKRLPGAGGGFLTSLKTLHIYQ
jgi:hypothetical protein